MPVAPTTDYKAQQGTASTAAGTPWNYSGTDANVMVNQPSTHMEGTPVYGSILNINEDGSIDVSTTDGRDLTLRSFNGKPVTKWVQTVDRELGYKNPVPYGGKSAYDPIDAPFSTGWTNRQEVQSTEQNRVHGHWELNHDALPALRTANNGPGNSTVQWFDIAPQGTNEKQDQTSIGNAIKTYSQMAGSDKPENKQKFKELQDRLYRGGFTSSKKLTSGVFDHETQAALDEALNSAAAEGKTLEDLLTDSEKAHPNGPPGTGNVITTHGREEVQKSVRDQAANLLGYQPDDAQIGSIMDSYNQMEIATQSAKNTGQGVDSTGTTLVSQVPNLDTYVHDKLVESNPVAAQGMQLGQHFSEFINMLGQGRG